MLQGNRTYIIQDENGQVIEDPFGFRRLGLSRRWARACVAQDSGRAQYGAITDEEALQAFS